MKYDHILVVTHIIYRKTDPYDALEGPYSSVCNALSQNQHIDTVQIPIDGYNEAIKTGPWKSENELRLPAFLGTILPIKYLIDFLLTIIFMIGYRLPKRGKSMLVIGIDPLSTLPLVWLKKVFGYTLIFYSVDFNKNRFQNKFMQWLYEKADEWATRGSDQTWVVCESLKDYKKEHFAVESRYIPNSSPFDGSLFASAQDKKKGNRAAWTGSLLTDRQFDILFGVLKKLEDLRPDMEFIIAPTGKHETFKEYAKKYKLKKCDVLHLTSRREWQEVAAVCDLGIAVYDDKFGSTYFIEPLKIWDFLMCGMPFIISCEPSLSTPIKEAGVVYLLGPANSIPNEKSLQQFIQKDYLKSHAEACVEIAKEYDIGVQIEKALSLL